MRTSRNLNLGFELREKRSPRLPKGKLVLELCLARSKVSVCAGYVRVRKGARAKGRSLTFDQGQLVLDLGSDGDVALLEVLEFRQGPRAYPEFVRYAKQHEQKQLLLTMLGTLLGFESRVTAGIRAVQRFAAEKLQEIDAPPVRNRLRAASSAAIEDPAWLPQVMVAAGGRSDTPSSALG